MKQYRQQVTITNAFIVLGWKEKFTKLLPFLKINPWNGHLPLGLFLAHTKIKQTPERLSCADEPAATDSGILAVLNSRQYHT